MRKPAEGWAALKITRELLGQMRPCWRGEEIEEYAAGRESVSLGEVLRDEEVLHAHRSWLLMKMCQLRWGRFCLSSFWRRRRLLTWGDTSIEVWDSLDHFLAYHPLEDVRVYPDMVAGRVCWDGDRIASYLGDRARVRLGEILRDRDIPLYDRIYVPHILCLQLFGAGFQADRFQQTLRVLFPDDLQFVNPKVAENLWQDEIPWVLTQLGGGQ